MDFPPFEIVYLKSAKSPVHAEAKHNSVMKLSVRKRITILLVSTLFLLALFPAFYPLEDEALRENGFFSKSYGQLFAAIIAFYDFGFNLCSLTTASSLEIPCVLPNALPASSETRAPPA
jgi:hypothetical protein